MNEEPRILVIDDEQVILDSARRILTAEGFSVATIEDAESGLQILEEQPFDIVISDLMLPGISGIEFLAAAHRQDPNLVVIITTGYSTVDNAVSSLRKGAFEFLPKPFTFDELLGPVQRASRFLDLPLKVRMQPLASDAADYYSLGIQTWARADADGSWGLGLTELLLQTVKQIESIEFPTAEAELRQGGRLVRFTTVDKLVHNVWSPLSGKVLAVNAQLQQAPDFSQQDSLTSGWLVRILPSDLDNELPNLISS